MLIQWLATLAVLALCAVFYHASLSLPELPSDPGGPALLPQWLCILTGGAAALSLVRLAVHTPWRALGSNTRQWIEETLRVDDGPDAAGAIRRRLAIVFAATLVYPAAISGIGFIASTFLLAGGLLLLFGTPIARSAATSAAVTATTYVFFAKVMGAYVPAGAIAERFF